MLTKTPINEIMFNKETVIEFLESKDPDETYNYGYPDTCAFAQFLKAHGTDPDQFYTHMGSARPPGVWHEIVFPPVRDGAQTFGAALSRAKKLLK